MAQLLMRRHSLENLPPRPLLAGELILRECTSSDTDPLSRLLADSFQDNNWTRDKVLQELIDAPDVVKTLGVFEHGVAAATASCRLLPEAFPGEGYVHWVGVAAKFRGMQLGYLVSLEVLREFERSGCKSAVLETDDFRLPAVKTYLKLGFEPVLRDGDHEGRWKAIMDQIRA